uniref:Uncharacterized protein n=1 Tax=Cannabis sativa TaxID=3483 RepID=A0A803R946_CANSA
MENSNIRIPHTIYSILVVFVVLLIHSSSHATATTKTTIITKATSKDQVPCSSMCYGCGNPCEPLPSPPPPVIECPPPPAPPPPSPPPVIECPPLQLLLHNLRCLLKDQNAPLHPSLLAKKILVVVTMKTAILFTQIPHLCPTVMLLQLPTFPITICLNLIIQALSQFIPIMER